MTSDVKELMMRRDEIGENCEKLKAKVVSYTTKTEQTRRGQKEMHVPMEVDYVSGSEPEEDWEDVDEVRRGSTCYNCGMMGHFGSVCKGKARVRGMAETEARDTPRVRARR